MSRTISSTVFAIGMATTCWNWIVFKTGGSGTDAPQTVGPMLPAHKGFDRRKCSLQRNAERVGTVCRTARRLVPVLVGCVYWRWGLG